MAAKFEIIKDKRGEYRFHLKAANGEIIASYAQFYSFDLSAQLGLKCYTRSNA